MHILICCWQGNVKYDCEGDGTVDKHKIANHADILCGDVTIATALGGVNIKKN